MTKRRDFIRNLTVGTAGLAIGGAASGFPAKNYSRIIGAGDRLNVAVIGLGNRDILYDQAISMAMSAGKHVYVEKPCSHNPHEAELLVACTKRYNKVVQMRNQYRSVPLNYADYYYLEASKYKYTQK
ncbi:MAG: Gfo/Idh/MocA family oxidoreductase [Bacteroidota bacterium]